MASELEGVLRTFATNFLHEHAHPVVRALVLLPVELDGLGHVDLADVDAWLRTAAGFARSTVELVVTAVFVHRVGVAVEQLRDLLITELVPLEALGERDCNGLFRFAWLG